jgi:predicted transcriptional regulator
MNKIAESILDRIADWPEEAQEELMQSIVDIEKKHLGVYRLNDDERAAVRRGLEEMRQGKFASDEQVEAVFNRYR